jgi:hypothetical protein
MTEQKSNPVWAFYCIAQGRGADMQLEHDRARYPGNEMSGFILWHQERLSEFSKEHPEALSNGALINPATYDGWLRRWVNRMMDVEIDDRLLAFGYDVT